MQGLGKYGQAICNLYYHFKIYIYLYIFHCIFWNIVIITPAFVVLPPAPFSACGKDEGGESECAFSKCCWRTSGFGNPFMHIGQINPSAGTSFDDAPCTPPCPPPATRTGEEKSDA